MKTYYVVMPKGYKPIDMDVLILSTTEEKAKTAYRNFNANKNEMTKEYIEAAGLEIKTLTLK